MAVVGKRAQYFGTVQGVGFRRRAERLASGRPVVGFVRNLDDGSVELVAEGDEVAVRALLDEVKARMSQEIVEVREREVPVSGYEGFTIRR